MEARGIHDHPTRKLGRAPADPTKPRLRLSRILKATAVPPPVPVAEDYTDIADWDMYGNDSYGDCGPAMVAHSRMQVSHYLTGTIDKPTLADVIDLYKRSGNPDFPKQDDGVVLQEMLNEVRKGGIGGTKAIAFAAVDQSNEAEMDAAMAIFGGLHYGVDLQAAQQRQTDTGVWDYKPSGEWGGHAIYGGGYTASRRRVVTWGEEVEFTDAFATHQLDEAWVVIWPEHLQSRQFLEGVDLDELAAAYKELTGDDLQLPEPPAPPEPAPTPTPEPTPPTPAPTPPQVAPSLDEVGDRLGAALADVTGEPVRHLRDRHKSGTVIEKFYITESGDWEIGVIDKR